MKKKKKNTKIQRRDKICQKELMLKLKQKLSRNYSKHSWIK